MRFGICGKALRAAWICISWAKTLSKVRTRHTLNCSFFRMKNEEVAPGQELSGVCDAICVLLFCFVFLNSVWSKGWANTAGRTEHLNPIINKNRPNLLMLLCISDLSLPTSYPHAPPSMDDKKNPLFNQQWQNLTQIVPGRLHGGLLSFTEAMGIHDTI